ncbi:MAG: 8-amino-7-oxononanoate synthase [Mariprofundaceae bacterium]|nr:8-amino-7-oxononanoate synthase [Mariprofundaceae bacterium]
MVDSRNWFNIIPSSRQRKLLASRRDGVYIEVEGQALLNFSSNDYLGLSTHPEVIQATQDAVQQHGLGSGASRLVSGDDPLLHALEQDLAVWKGFEACLLLGSGMLANMGLLPALATRHTHVFTDKLNHASLVDGARLSGAKVFRYPHLSVEMLDMLLQRLPASRRLIVSDGVFSMDGDVADVAGLLALAEQHDALLLIDDAHGTGTLGKSGKGVVDLAGIAGHARVLEVGTLGKALGSYGAYVLGTTQMIEGLRQRMRTLMYSTALPVPVLAGAKAALHVLQRGFLLQKLQQNITYFLKQAENIPLVASLTAIQPVLLGTDAAALKAARQLREAGFFVPAIRPPTVPEGEARLRITLSASHEPQHIDGLVKALSKMI